jgi:phenylalanyl-tRNA synthetase beta chain
MLASNAWLKQLTGLALDPREVAARFTSAGIEVEAIHRHGDGLERVVVAEVRAIRPHPKREKLRLVTVFDGDAEQEVVCGAPNVPAPGGRVALAQLGARLPGGVEIAERDLGGVTSRGMLCSERELAIGTSEEGILVLEPGQGAEPGSPLAAALALHDSVYELSLTPNRPDCLGHVGLARELCALFGAPFKLPVTAPAARLAAAPAGTWPQSSAVFALPLGTPSAAAGNSGLSPVRVDVADGARCPRYGAALVHGLTVGPAPFWLRHRLHVLGLRSISNVVDATNYILLLWGHPIHGFDYDQLHESRIAVRLARAGERMRTLDGAEQLLTEDDLLICDGRGPVALAGVMGGASSEIRDSTQRVLIECAYFDPRSVRRTSKRTGLHTDSSHRFERGVDHSAVRAVLASAAAVIAEVGGGTVVAEALDVVALPIEQPTLRLRLSRATALLGKPVDPARARSILCALGCELKAEQGDELLVQPPGHRPDLGREVDLIEEVARVQGYDQLPTELPRLRASELGTPAPIVLARQLRAAASGAGLSEAINYAFVATGDLRAARAPETALKIVNPLSEERSVLRSSLLPGLAANLRTAQRQQLTRFAQFELARVFSPQPKQLLPLEQQHLAFLLWGERADWFTEGTPFDFYDAKGCLDAIVRALCGQLPELVLDDALDRDAPELHPRRRARVLLAGRPIGSVGELHPQAVEALELTGRPLWASVLVPALADALAALGPARAETLARFPAATRDLAVVVPEAVPAGEVAAALQAAGGRLAERVSLFDLYRGEPVPAGHKSLAFHVVYRDPEATLTDKAVDAVHAGVVKAADARFGALLRR